MYVNRTYRASHALNRGRTSFCVSYRKSDMWVAVDSDSFCEDMPEVCHQILVDMWAEMERYLATDPEYARALVPYAPREGAPEIFVRMSAASSLAGIGPMGGVAAACSEHLAVRLAEQRPYREIIIENGGDVFALTTDSLDVAVWAGESPLSGKVGFRVPSEGVAVGVCTSSGTVGPSLSFGVADAVMVVCRDAVLADCLATAYANRVQSVKDVESVAEAIGAEKEVIAAAVVKDDRIAIAGELMPIFFK